MIPRTPPGLEEHGPAAFMSLATHSLETHHNGEKKFVLCHHGGCRGGNLACFCSTSSTQHLGSNPVVTEILGRAVSGESENQIQTG